MADVIRRNEALDRSRIGENTEKSYKSETTPISRSVARPNGRRTDGRRDHRAAQHCGIILGRKRERERESDVWNESHGRAFRVWGLWRRRVVPIGRKRRNKTLNPTQRQLARPPAAGRRTPRSAGNLLQGPYFDPKKERLEFKEIWRECKIQTMGKYRDGQKGVAVC